MAAHLDTQVEAFRNRPLDAAHYTFVWMDALTVKVREHGRTVNVHALIAVGVNADGQREVLGLDVASDEDGAGWLAFLRSLTARGLSGVKLVISDAHRGLVAAIGAALPGASWQRCRTHYLRNLLAKVPKSAQPWVATLVRTVFDQPDADAVHAQYTRVVATIEATRSFPTPQHISTPPATSCWRSPPSARDLAADLVQQPARAPEQGDPPPHQRRRDLPQPGRHHPPRRRGPRRADRRMGRRTPLHGPRTTQQSPADRRHRRTTTPPNPTQPNSPPNINHGSALAVSYTTPADVTRKRRDARVPPAVEPILMDQTYVRNVAGALADLIATAAPMTATNARCVMTTSVPACAGDDGRVRRGLGIYRSDGCTPLAVPPRVQPAGRHRPGQNVGGRHTVQVSSHHRLRPTRCAIFARRWLGSPPDSATQAPLPSRPCSCPPRVPQRPRSTANRGEPRPMADLHSGPRKPPLACPFSLSGLVGTAGFEPATPRL